jgi:hypothetical protein
MAFAFPEPELASAAGSKRGMMKRAVALAANALKNATVFLAPEKALPMAWMMAWMMAWLSVLPMALHSAL